MKLARLRLPAPAGDAEAVGTTPQKGGEIMEELQEVLVDKIGKLVQKADEKDVQMLDVLNRLLGTVNGWLISQQPSS